MRFAIFSLLLSSLVLPTPAVSRPFTDQQIELVVQICQKDLIKYADGDADWLERNLSQIPDPDFRARVYDMCKMYARGMLDGIAVGSKHATEKCKACITKTSYRQEQ